MYLPLFFDARRLPCLVVGGGKVGAHKVGLLLSAGAILTVVAPAMDDQIRTAVDRGLATWRAREFRPGDCEGFRLVVAATPLEPVNRAVSDEAKRLGIPVNVVDAPEMCTFIFGANWHDGPLTVSVSTGGRAPFMASAVRDLVAETAGGMGDWVAVAAKFRAAVRREVASPTERALLFRMFVTRSRLGPPAYPFRNETLAEWLEWLKDEGKPR